MVKNKEYFLERIKTEIGINPISVFSYGSRVYGTNTENSDYDFIVVTEDNKEYLDSYGTADGIVNCSVYSRETFLEFVKQQKIQILECLFLDDDKILLNSEIWNFELDLMLLRKNISSSSSNSWVKAKKKLIDGEIYIAQKSLFHSLRIPVFGKQIAAKGKIYDYSEANYIWEEIKGLDTDWDLWKSKFQNFRNSTLTEFRLLLNNNPYTTIF